MKKIEIKTNKQPKITNEEALAKIKVWIQKYFEDVGREIVDDVDSARISLIDEIEDIIYNTEIPTKNIITEKLELDEKARSEGEHFWTP